MKSQDSQCSVTTSKVGEGSWSGSHGSSTITVFVISGPRLLHGGPASHIEKGNMVYEQEQRERVNLSLMQQKVPSAGIGEVTKQATVHRSH